MVDRAHISMTFHSVAMPSAVEVTNGLTSIEHLEIHLNIEAIYQPRLVKEVSFQIEDDRLRLLAWLLDISFD